MKKVAILSFFFSFSTLIAAAATSPEPKQGKDPKKQETPTTNFALSKGYFSLFNIWTETRQQADTLKTYQAKPAGGK